MSIPNQITLGRLVLAIGFFVLLSFFSAGRIAETNWVLSAAFWVFLVAALGDVLDGWLARRLNQVTTFGRVVDPVVDKVMICGAFIFFCSSNFVDPATQRNISGVAPWMATVVLLRELFVSAIRAFREASGGNFAAIWVGKLKMFVQSAAVCIVLAVLAWGEPQLAWARIGAVWATVIVTALSIISYIGRARDVLFSRQAMGSPSLKRRDESSSPAQPPGVANESPPKKGATV